MLETSMNFSVPYTMNTADINIRLMKITMSPPQSQRLINRPLTAFIVQPAGQRRNIARPKSIKRFHFP
jgi:hypothetical protein